MFNIERKRIYSHTQLQQADADVLVPLVESAFRNELSAYTGNREEIGKERVRFVSEQFANRARIAGNMNVSPLFEDAQIFGNVGGGQLKKMFEDAPASIIGMGEVSNAQAGNSIQGGMWNPAYKAGSGDLPSYVFGLQNHIALNCIGFDLMPTIAVDTPKILISYVDTVYGGGTFDDAENMPSYLEVSSSVFTRAFVKAKSLKRATTEVIFVASTGEALKVRFIVASTVKAALTVEVLATGTAVDTAGTLAYTFDDSLSVKSVVDAINAATGSKVYTATPTVVASGTAIENVVIGYASAIRTNIAEAASNNNSLGGMSRAQQEKGPKHKLNVIAMDKQLEVVGLEIEADTSNIQIKDMAAIGVNVISHLYTGVQNQLVQSLDEVILTHLYKLGVQHALQVYESQSKNYSLYIDAPTNTSIAMNTIDVMFENMLGEDVRTQMGSITNALQSAGYENQMTHAQRLYSRILLIAEFVGQQNRISPPDFIVASGTLCACLKKNAEFTACPVSTNFSNNPELHYVGSVYETINVYKNPKILFDDPRILFGRRGNDKDPGAKFLAYDLAASRQVVAQDTMAEKIRVWSRFAIADIGFYPELNYYTGVFINKYEWA